ncbi:hypothetical protein FLL45_03665 [Aliikangiella marina]|uniref:HAMP domain-containing histidine kinase n=1 Tax=Aliikangiella marina TaxID=1712262 RepID=A0A545TIL0_9GAMM|nr:hypothetical protein [Aliikangiella marina]TQV77062.1 hypothetical protein FLL45_03665 [Aliikangiella marina]
MANQDLTDDILGLIVHSYNNYLSGAMGFNELIKLDCDDQSVIDKLDLSLASSKEAVDFGSQLLASISRLQVHFNDIEVREIIERVVNTVVLEKRVDPQIDMHLVHTDPEWFIRSISMIVDFIRQLSPTSSIVLRANINSEETEVNLRIGVTDLSFTAQQQKRLFEPFYSSRHLLGTKDVGIAVSSGFIKQMNGELSWQEGQGFLIRLPVFE